MQPEDAQRELRKWAREIEGNLLADINAYTLKRNWRALNNYYVVGGGIVLQALGRYSTVFNIIGTLIIGYGIIRLLQFIFSDAKLKGLEKKRVTIADWMKQDRYASIIKFSEYSSDRDSVKRRQELSDVGFDVDKICDDEQSQQEFKLY